MATSPRESEPPVRHVEAWRDGSWVVVALDGEVVWRRLTSDPAFEQVKVCFYSNQSPSLPKSRYNFQHCELLGAWREAKDSRFYRNSMVVPIRASRTSKPDPDEDWPF